MPPPTRMSGRSAVSKQSGGVDRSPRGPAGCAAQARATSSRSIQKSLGGKFMLGRDRHPPARRRTTGPGRPEVATAKARRKSSGMRSYCFDPDQLLDRRSQNVDLAASPGSCSSRRERDACRRQSRPSACRRCSDSTKPVTRLVAPGPSVAVAYARPIGDPRVGIGRKGAAALVVDQKCRMPS